MSSIPTSEGPGRARDFEPTTAWTRLGRATSLLALALLLLATLILWRLSEAKAEADHKARFEAEVTAALQAYGDRMEEYGLVLEGARGLFAQGFPVGPEGWRTYVQGLNLDHARPGIQGIGFSRRLRLGEASAIEQAMRTADPTFHVWPEEGHPGSAITLLEPREGRNLRAIGFDMLSEPIRRAALESARDSGEATISGKVTLVQEDDADPQPGFLLYLPVFPGGIIPGSREARREGLMGWVYCPFRMRDFSRAVLGSKVEELRIEVFDGEATADRLMYDSSPRATPAPRWTSTPTLRLQGRTWSLRVSSLPAFERLQDQRTPRWVLLLGALISLLIFGLLDGLVRLRRRALTLAREMTSALRGEQEHVRRILDSTAEGIYGLDMDGRCTFVNEAFTRFSRCAPEDLLGHSIHAMAHHTRPDGSAYPVEACPIYKALQTGTRLRLEGEWFWRMDGSGYWANVVVAPILAHGAPVGSVVTLEDVTQQREAERLKHDFVSVVSHELRTPLTSIRGTLGLLASDRFKDDPEESRKLLLIAMRNAERLGTLINDILDFEKLRAGHLSLTLEPVPLKDLLVESIEGNLPFAAGFQVMLHLRPGIPEVTLRVDRKRMVQVLTNLLSNAVKFSPEGSQVDIHADIREARVAIHVEDRGRGIPKAFQDRVFTPFSQAESPETRSREGSGLGLAITKALVEDMGGSLGFTSEVGTGTTFTVELPFL